MKAYFLPLQRVVTFGFLICILLVTTTCNFPGSEPEPVGEQPPDAAPEEPGAPLEEILIVEFDDGIPPNWEAEGWRAAEGMLISEGEGAFLFAMDEWDNFILAANLLRRGDSAAVIVLRATERGSYHLVLAPDEVILLQDVPGKEPIPFGAHPRETGEDWQEVEIRVEGEQIQVRINGEDIFDVGGADEFRRGNIGFLALGPGEVALNRVEIQPVAGEVAQEPSEPASKDDPKDDKEPPKEFGEYLGMEQVIVEVPPVAALIIVEQPNQQGYVRVTGSPGAVVSNALVVFSCLDVASFDYVMAESDGSFSAEVLAPGGTALLIKHLHQTSGVREFLAGLPPVGSGDLEIESLNATAGMILPVPLTISDERGKTFGLAGRLPGETDAGIWALEAALISTPKESGGQVLLVDGTLRLFAPEINPGMDLMDVHGGSGMNFLRVFDQNGVQVSNKQYMASRHMTPTGLPIARDSHGISPVNGGGWFGEFEIVAEGVAATEIGWEYEIPATVPPGYYAPVIEVGFGHGDDDSGLPFAEPFGYWMRPGFIFGYSGGYLPLTRIGNPEAPQLTWTLLTDTLNQGTRGTIAREDEGKFGLIPFTTFPSQTFIIPRENPRTGEPLTYSLEPYLPFISLDDRGVPNAPIIDFDYPSGELKITVQKPDGITTQIGPAAFQQSSSRSPAWPNGHLRDNNGGGAMHDVYQAITTDEDFAIRFEQYGHYVITLEGQLADMWGTTLEGRGTYDVHVARHLKLYTGLLPGTPFEVGDVLAPTIQTYPRVPADITLTISHYPDSDKEKEIVSTLDGTANEYGYYYPPPTAHSPLDFSNPGEYRLDLTASYTDPDGVLWMGSMSWGGVVETPNAEIVAHGRRGIDAHEVDQLWFFHEQTGFEGIGHSFYPYATGDIYWGAQAGPYPDMGSDNIKPVVTIQDRVGRITELIRAAQGGPLMPDEVDLQERIVEGELPLFSALAGGEDIAWDPAAITQYGYGYRVSARPGARVHESVAEGELASDYWRYDANYGDQVGIEGDLPHDLKWEFGGAVFRNLPQNINQYAIYGSLWVLIPDDDPLGPRVMPPFRGAAGGPDGGPILTLKGQEIDIFFLPKSAMPGQIFTVGDTVAFAGHVGPPLDSDLAVTITAPSGNTRTIAGQANKIGYFYQPQDDFIVDEPGLWAVDVRVTHTGMTSAGAVVEPYPTGDVLGSQAGRYYFYVVAGEAAPLEIVAPQSGFLPLDGKNIPPIEVVAEIPAGVAATEIHYTIAMPGYILEQGTVSAAGDTFTVTYDPVALHDDFPNIDLTAFDAYRPGLADQIWISFVVVTEDGNAFAGTVTLHGEEVLVR